MQPSTLDTIRHALEYWERDMSDDRDTSEMITARVDAAIAELAAMQQAPTVAPTESWSRITPPVPMKLALCEVEIAICMRLPAPQSQE